MIPMAESVSGMAEKEKALLCGRGLGVLTEGGNVVWAGSALTRLGLG